MRLENKGELLGAVASSVNPSVSGQSVTLTATVSVNSPGSTAVAKPTGTVTFKDGSTTLGAGTLSTGVGVTTASYTTSALSTATHSITASYNDDVNFNGSPSSALSQLVNKADTATAVTSSVNPSVSGQAVTLTATVSVNSPGSNAVANPTGTVTFNEGLTTLGTGTLSTSGGVTTATFSTNRMSTSSHNLSATYGGDSNFITSSGSLTQAVI